MREIITKFSTFTLKQISRKDNREVDVLARLASAAENIGGRTITLLRVEGNAIEEKQVGEIMTGEDWRKNIIQHLTASEDSN